MNDKNGTKRKLDFVKVFAGLLIGATVFFIGVIAGQERIVHFDINPKAARENTNLPNKLNYDGVEEIYDKLKTNFDGDLDQTKLEDGLKKGLVNAAGDPYTEYLNAEEAKDFQSDLSGSFEGIGAELGKKDDSIVIISPIKGLSSRKAGLKSGDYIIEIDGESATDLSISEAVKKIRGPKGTKVKLGIVRDGKKLDIEITREQITIASVTSEVVEGNIGVIKISTFGEDTVELATKAAEDLKAKNVTGVILDMRGNPGGLLDAAVGVSSLWLPNGDKVLDEKQGGKVIDSLYAEGNPVLGGIKTVVLVDGGSASASEITAGALHDNKVATIIGTKTYGKGSVQEVHNLDFGGILKVTVARWYTPNGVNIDKEGIKPDKEVKISDKDIEAKKDPQKEAAVKFLNK